MANQNKQNQGGGGQMGNDPGKGAGGKPFGGGDASERSQPGLEEDIEEQGYDIDVEGPTKKEAGSQGRVDDWRDRPDQGSHKPQK